MDLEEQVPDTVIAGPWTQFIDTRPCFRLPWKVVYIQASKEKAISVFEETMGIDPTLSTYGQYGRDYVINEYDDLLQATGYYRHALYDLHKGPDGVTYGAYTEESDPDSMFTLVPLADFCRRKNILIVTRDQL